VGVRHEEKVFELEFGDHLRAFLRVDLLELLPPSFDVRADEERRTFFFDSTDLFLRLVFGTSMEAIFIS